MSFPRLDVRSSARRSIEPVDPGYSDGFEPNSVKPFSLCDEPFLGSKYSPTDAVRVMVGCRPPPQFLTVGVEPLFPMRHSFEVEMLPLKRPPERLLMDHILLLRLVLRASVWSMPFRILSLLRVCR